MSAGAIIAEFACARDAQLFAGLKREVGEPVVHHRWHQLHVRACASVRTSIRCCLEPKSVTTNMLQGMLLHLLNEIAS